MVYIKETHIFCILRSQKIRRVVKGERRHLVILENIFGHVLHYGGLANLVVHRKTLTLVSWGQTTWHNHNTIPVDQKLEFQYFNIWLVYKFISIIFARPRCCSSPRTWAVLWAGVILSFLLWLKKLHPYTSVPVSAYMYQTVTFITNNYLVLYLHSPSKIMYRSLNWYTFM